MHPDLANLLGALRDQPDDELAYMALADWCLEQPDEATQARAEHIRLSREVVKLPRPTHYGPEYAARVAARKGLQQQVKALERRHRLAWLGTMRDLAHRCDFLPGGLVKLELTGGRARQARKEQVPSPHLADFAWVSTIVARTVSAEDMLWFADALPVGIVRSFTLSSDSPGPEVVAALTGCRWLPGLRALTIHAHHPNRWTIDVARVASLTGGPSLRELGLSHLDLGLRCCEALANSPYVRGLQSFTVSYCGLPAGHVGALGALGALGPLMSLALAQNQMDHRGVRELVAWPALAGVRRLDLHNNPIGDEGAAALARAPFLSDLRELNIASCGITNRGLRALASVSFTQLESLNISDNIAVASDVAAALQRRVSPRTGR
jgi:uncharacterized protein (TIGR02996 family)